MIRVSAPIFVLLLFVVWAVLKANSGEMCGPPLRLPENRDLTKWKSSKGYSDYKNVTYSLKGIGADQYPFNVFVIDPHTGDIRVTQVLDREFKGFYRVR